MSTNLTVREDDRIAPTKLLEAIAAAVSNPAVDVAKMESLYALHERIMKDQREVAFMDAMSRLQSKLQPMVKYGQGKNSKFVKYEYMHLTIKPLLAEEGFSFSFDEESHTDKTVTLSCTLSHRAGHKDTKRLTVHTDAAATNREGRAIRPAIQDDGSTVSYARRYLVKMHLDIVETDEDTDGMNAQPITEDQARDIETLLTELKANKEGFLAFMGAESIREILARDYQKATNALNAKRKAQK